ncbi:hypothetical protein, variant 1 [Exophiala oligosperma]|nr:hypothetical protein, variant 1 [Exophiala oligosperma]KIW40651.1 hypothetical protein, variant 1 [Exophiala oligosperma]
MTGQGSHFPQAEDTISSGGGPGLDTRQPARQNPDDGLGTAAIGTTSTYSSHYLAKGDPVGNVADPQSADPTTYKMPEHMYGSSGTGVPEGAAGTAASLAFNKDRQQSTSQIPGAFPKDESSPHDSTRAASAATSGFTGSGTTRDPYGSRGLEAASGGAAGTGGSSSLGQGVSAAAAGVATENALSRGGTTHDATTIAPSGLTSTTSPADRSAGFGAAEKTKVPDETATGSNQGGTFGKILGAMGLGAAAGGATAAATRGRENEKPDAVSGTPDQPTTTTGVSSYTAPTESTPSTAATQPPTHYRKESIPTSAYPAGQDSPAPINPPVGGTAAAVNEREHKDHTGRNAGLAAAGVGAGALGAHELGKHRSEPGEINEYSIGSSAQNTTPAAPYAPATSTGTERGMAQGQTTATPYNDSTPESDSKGYGKTAAAAGLGAGAAGAGAYALGHERNKPETGDLRAEKPYTSSESATQPPATTSQLPVREKQAGPATTSTSGEYPTEHTPAADDRRTGRNAALAGAAGAGAGAYGAHEYNKHRAAEDPSVGRQGPTTSTKDTKIAPVAASSQPAVERSTRNDPTAAPEQDKSHAGRDAALAGAAGTGAGAYGAHEYNKHHAEQDPSAARQVPTTSTKDTSAARNDTKATPIAASSGPTSDKAARTDPAAPEQGESHTGRDAALAGAAGAGAGAYGAHEYSKHEVGQDAANAEARRQKDLAEQEAARQKQFEKDQKAAEKQAHKEEKQHQKELAKEHKAQEKAAAKEEKEHQKGLEKEEKKHDKELAAGEAEHERHPKKEEQPGAGVEAEEAERHRRREKEAAAAAAVGGTGAAAAYGAHEHDQKSDAQKQHEQESLDTAYGIGKQSAGSQGGRPAVVADDGGHNVLHKDPPHEEKKPNIFKRIFKRRKNKDTGEEEEYSTDDDEDHGHGHDGRHAAEAGVLGAGAGAGVAGAETSRHEPGSTTSRISTEQHHGSSYEEQSGGLQKPSYNPFSKQSPTSANYGQQQQQEPVAADPSHSGPGVGRTNTSTTTDHAR